MEPVDETPPKVENNRLAKLKMLQQLSAQLEMLYQLKKMRQQRQSVTPPSNSPDLGYLSSLQIYMVDHVCYFNMQMFHQLVSACNNIATAAKVMLVTMWKRSLGWTRGQQPAPLGSLPTLLPSHFCQSRDRQRRPQQWVNRKLMSSSSSRKRK